MSSVAAGWYPSPEDPTQVRYWDGVQWTQYIAAAGAPATAPATPTGPPVSSAPVYSAPAVFASPLPPAPPGASATAAPANAQKRWLIGGAIAAGVIVVGSVGAAIGAGGSDRDDAPQASAAPAVVQTEEPATEPTPTPTAAPAPTTEVPVIDAVAFRAQATSHLDDMVKDLDDMVITVQEDGFWRLLSNSGELAFNLGQLEALDVPSNAAATWPTSLTGLDTALDGLSDAVSTEDGPTILAAIELVRAQVDASRGVVDTAQ